MALVQKSSLYTHAGKNMTRAYNSLLAIWLVKKTIALFFSTLFEGIWKYILIQRNLEKRPIASFLNEYK